MWGREALFIIKEMIPQSWEDLLENHSDLSSNPPSGIATCLIPSSSWVDSPCLALSISESFPSSVLQRLLEVVPAAAGS